MRQQREGGKAQTHLTDMAGEWLAQIPLRACLERASSSTGPPWMRLRAHAFSSLCNEAGVAWRLWRRGGIRLGGRGRRAGEAAWENCCTIAGGRMRGGAEVVETRADVDDGR